MRQLIKILEILRKNMPQVRGKDTPELLKTLADNGIAYRQGKVAVDKLKFTQDDYIPSKVDAIASSIEQGNPLHAIVISSDGYVMDGHHRVLAVNRVHGKNYRMSVVMIMLPKLKALTMFDNTADEINGEK